MLLCCCVMSVERTVRQLPVRSLHATSRLLDKPAPYNTYQSLPPAPAATLSLSISPSNTSDNASPTLRFAWYNLLEQVCSFLQRASAAEELSVDECGAIGSFISDEIQLHAIELTSERINSFQHHMDGLLAYSHTKEASDAAVERIVRFSRGQLSALPPAKLSHLQAACFADTCVSFASSYSIRVECVHRAADFVSRGQSVAHIYATSPRRNNATSNIHTSPTRHSHLHLLCPHVHLHPPPLHPPLVPPLPPRRVPRTATASTSPAAANSDGMCRSPARCVRGVDGCERILCGAVGVRVCLAYP